ncbi:MAG: hypothetical protein ACSHXY_07855 [Alphaproteobacteria bacterium]
MRDASESANLAKSSSYALQGLAFGLVLTFMSMTSFRLWGFEAAFTFIPLMGIFFWPRGASSGLSGVFIFGIGLSVDVLSAGPVGLWAFIYLACYGILRPDQRDGDYGFGNLWLQFSIWAVIVAAILFFAGWLFIDGITASGALASQLLLSLVVFPFVFALNQGLQYIAGETEYSR